MLGPIGMVPACYRLGWFVVECSWHYGCRCFFLFARSCVLIVVELCVGDLSMVGFESGETAAECLEGQV